MTDIVGYIGASLTIAKGLLEICKEYNNVILIKQISDLTLQLAQAQTEAAELINENRNLKEEAERQETNPLTFKKPVYYDRNQLSYCPACYDNLKKRIHLKTETIEGGGTSFTCPICKTNFEDYLEED